MVDKAERALGMSIGATNLAVVTADNAITRKPVLTLYRQRPPEVGVPSENPRLDEPGLVIGDFVERVGQPQGIVAADGSVHLSEALIADALRALAYTATGGAALPNRVAVAYPAHWPDAAVESLGASLSRVSEWSNRAHPLVLMPDAAAALVAARSNPGIPTGGTSGGTVAVCDFGGSGASITLMDATDGYRALAPTVRHHDFSGNLIDQALLTAVMGNLPGIGSSNAASTLASGWLSRLRAECRSAKEQLSSESVATLADELAGVHGDFRLTRNELDEVIRESLNRFVSVLEETLARNQVRNLVAIVAVGGGANVPAITTTLSGRLRVPVVAAPHPQLTPAIGAALRAARGPDAAGTTVARPAPPVPATAPAAALAWPHGHDSPAQAFAAQETATRLPVESEGGAVAASEPPSEPHRPRRYRRAPAVAAVVGLVVLLLSGAAVAFALSSTGREATKAPPAPPPSASRAAPPPPASPAPAAPAPPTSENSPPATTETPTTTVPPAAPQARPPAAQAPRKPAVPAAPQIPAEIPALPPIPGVNEPIPGLDRVNEWLRELESGQIPR